MPSSPFFDSNTLVDQYRAWYRAKHGQDDPRPNREITVWIGNGLRARGDTQTEERFPDFREHYLTLTQSANDRGTLGEVGAGLSRGWRGLVGTAAGAAGLALDWLPDSLVDPATARSVLGFAKEKLDDGGANRPRVQRFGDIRDVDTAVDYVAGKVGEVLPSVGEAVVTAAAGAVAGSSVAPGPGTLGGGAAGLLGKRAIKNLIRKGVREAAEIGSEEGVKRALLAGGSDALRRAFRSEVRSLGARLGGAAASTANSFGLSAGEIYSELGDDPTLPEGTAREVATLFGIPAALADTALPTYIVGKFFRGAAAEATAEAIKPRASYFRRLAAELPVTLGGEGSTESFQELVNIAAEKFARNEEPRLTAADVERITEAGISGLAGGALGAPIAAAGGGARASSPRTAAPDAAAPAPTQPSPPRPPPRPRPSATAAAEKPPAITLAQVVVLDEAAQRQRLAELEGQPTRDPEEDRQLVFLRAKYRPVITPPVAMIDPAETASGGAPTPPPPPVAPVAEPEPEPEPAATPIPAAAPAVEPTSGAVVEVVEKGGAAEQGSAAPTEGPTPAAAAPDPAPATEPPAPAPAPPKPAPRFAFDGPITEDSRDFHTREVPPHEQLLGEGIGGHKGLRTQSRAALALYDPTNGKVYLRTANRYNKGEGLRRIDNMPGAKNATGISLTGMGRLAGKKKESKVFDPAGNQQVLLEDLERTGLKVVARINLPETRTIVQDFDTLDDFDAALGAHQRVPVVRSISTADIVTGDAALAVAEAEAATGEAKPAGGDIVLEDAANAEKAGGLVVTKATPAPAASSTGPLTPDEAASAVGIDTLARLATNLQKITEPRRRSTVLQGMLVEGQYPAIREFIESNPGRGALNAVLKAIENPPADAVARSVPPQFALGVVTPGGEVRSVPRRSAEELADATASLVFPGQMGNKFRYRQGQVLWAAAPTVDERLAAEGHLARQGAAVTRHYDMAGGQFFGALAQRPDPTDPGRPLSEAETRNYEHTLARLKQAGVDVRQLPPIIAHLQGLARDLLGYYSRSENAVALVIDDVTRPRFEHLLTLLHETAHYQFGQLDAAVRRRLTAAVGRVSRGMIERLGSPATRLDNPEEFLVESVAKALAAQGFTEPRGMAAHLWARLREFYHAAVLRVRELFNVPVAPEQATAYLQARVARFLHAPHDASAAAAPRRLVPHRFFGRVDPLAPDELFDAVAREIQRPDLLPETAAAAAANREWARRRELPADLQARTAGTPATMPYRVAAARIDVAALTELEAALAEIMPQLGTRLAPKEVWDKIGRGELPGDVINAIVALEPGANAAVRGGEMMTDAMNDQAAFKALRLIEAVRRNARSRAATRQRQAEQRADELSELATSIHDVEARFRDADTHNDNLVKRLRGAVKNLARLIDDGIDAAEYKGDLAATIREFEKLGDRDPIPADYQRVFKALLDSKTLSVFDYFQEIAKLGLDLGSSKIPEVRAAVEQAAASGNATLKKLVAQRPLFAAVVSLARNAQREMDLLALRVMRNTEQLGEIYADLEQIRTAGEAELAAMSETLEQAGEARSLRDRLRADYLRVRRQMRLAEAAVQRALDDAALQHRAADLLGEPIKRLYEVVGNRPTWEPAHGATFVTFTRKASGEWQREDIELQMAGDTISQADRIEQAIEGNRRWLEENRADQATPLWQLVKSQTDKLGLVDFRKRYAAAHRFLLDRMLQSLGEKFASAGGVAGARLAQRLKRFQFLTRTYADEAQAQAHQWARALQDAARAAGYGTRWRAFLRDVYTPVVHAIQNEPGLEEADALKLATQVAREHVDGRGAVDAAALREQLARLLRLTKQHSEREDRVMRENGVDTQDERLVVENPLTGDREFIKRNRIRQGWLTVPRRLRREVIELLDVVMQRAGWGDPTKFDAVVADLTSEEDPVEFDAETFDAAVAPYFTPDVVRDFLLPFVRKPGRPAFPAVPFKGKDRRYNLDQTIVGAAWDAAGGSLGRFIQSLAAYAPGEVDVNLYAANVLRQLERLYAMEHRLAQRSKQPTHLFDKAAGPNHRMLDARTNDLLPAEHLEYDTYDPTAARVHLAELAFHAAFGRGGEGVDADLQALELHLKEAANVHASLATLPKSERAAEAKRLGYDLRTLERAAEAARNLPEWKAQLEAQFSYGNNAGVVGDAQLGMELLHFSTMMILNQPKSGLWNLLSIADFPQTLGGVNLASARAMGVATADFFKGVFGSFFEAFGLQLLRATEYSKDLGELIDHTRLNALTAKELAADTGMGGRFDQNRRARVVRWIRQMRTLLGKGAKLPGVDVGEKEFAQFNALWAPFNFIGNRMVHGVAMGNVDAYERIVRRAVEYFEAHPDEQAEPAFRFTAAHLGMEGKGWFGESGAFEYFRDKSVEYGLGRIEDVARQVIRRRTEKGTDARVLTKEQVQALGLMAMTEVSLESNINSRPSELATNPVLKYTFPLLGWPLAKMNQVHRALKTREGQVELASVLRGLGTLAMWSLPVGLAYSLAMDEYDEEILGKKSNLREVDPLFTVPLVGPAVAAMGGTEHGFWQNASAALERIARAGNVYGLGGDLINSVANWVDPTAGQRDFSLDNRVLVMSMIGNARDALRNFVAQDQTYTYGSVGRPLLTLLGGQSVLQYWQILNQATGADNVESRVTNSINASNHLRAAGRATGLSLRGGGGSASPTPVSVWVREMQYAAYAGDRTAFLQAYRNAVLAAREDGAEDAEQRILQSWRSRHPMAATFAARPTEREERELFAEMDEDGAAAVRQAVRQHELFGRMIEPSASELFMSRRLPTANRIRARLQPRVPAPLR